MWVTYLFLIKESAIAGCVLYVNCHLASFLVDPPHYLAMFTTEPLVTDGNVIVRQPPNLKCRIHDFNLFADSSPIQRCQSTPDLSHYWIVVTLDLVLYVALLLVYMKV